MYFLDVGGTFRRTDREEQRENKECRYRDKARGFGSVGFRTKVTISCIWGNPEDIKAVKKGIAQCENILMKARVLPASPRDLSKTNGANFPKPITVDHCSSCGPFLLQSTAGVHENTTPKNCSREKTQKWK